MPTSPVPLTCCVALFAFALTFGGCRRIFERSDKPDQQPTLPRAPATMSAPNFSGSITTSFSYPYASSLRNSQVVVVRKRYAGFERRKIENCGSQPEPTRSPPFALVVSPDGQRGILSWSNESDLFNATGCARRMDAGDPVALDGEVFINGTGLTWEPKGLAEPSLNGPAVARRIENERQASIINYPVNVPGGLRPPALGIEGGYRHQPSSPSWYFVLHGHTGVAAIGADFTVVLAVDNGMLQVYSLVPHARELPTLVAERNVGIAAKWVSIIGQHIMFVAPDGAGSKLQVFAGDTTPVYSLSVPFEVLQPAVAGKGGRAYLVGKGIAAVDDGKVTWTHPSNEPIYASTFEDGSLALATGKRLDFVKPDGTVDQTFNTEEPLVAPPAIAGDGSVWAASATALYIAR